MISLLTHQERCTPETPFEEVLMFLSLRVLCVMSAFLILTAATPTSVKPKDTHVLPPRATATVDHIVVVMMKSRSLNHLLGGHSTADVRATDLSSPDDQSRRPLALHAPGYQGASRTSHRAP